jgi:transcription antitermination factor NusG
MSLITMNRTDTITIEPGCSWYAVEVAYKKELVVASALGHKSFECYVPLYESRKVWTDRIKVVSLPLFSGYVFCRFDPNGKRLPILMTPFVRQVVSINREPAPIPDAEIDGIRLALESGAAVEPCERLQSGSRVTVSKGPFTGFEGDFVRYQGKDRLILSISLINRAVAVEIDRAFVEPLTSRRKPIGYRAVDPLQPIYGRG